MNVILIMMDTLRRDHLGCYGNPWIKTPALDTFAQRSTVFTNSFMGSYPCMPARQDLFTGKCTFPWRGWSPMEYQDRDLAHALRERGIITQLVTDHYHLWGWGSGNYHMSFNGVELIRGQEDDNWITDSSIPITYPADPKRMKPAFPIYFRNTAHFSKEEDYFAPSVFRAATRWVENNYDQESFFLLIDSFDPHEPWSTPETYWRQYDPEWRGEHNVWPPYGRCWDRFSPEELHHIHSLYSGEVTMSDKWFGHFMDQVERLGLLENTMVIVTTDHGFLFGEHDWIGKHSSTLWNEVSHTPLMIYHPNQAMAGKRLNQLVQLYDLYPTVLQAFGINTPEAHGVSLLPHVLATDEGPATRPAAVYGAFGKEVYACDGEWVYVRRPQNPGPLYWYTQSHFLQFEFGNGPNQPKRRDLDVTRHRLSDFKDGRFLVQCAEAHFVPEPDELYHVGSDYRQEHNLADQHPDVTARLRGEIRSFLTRLGGPAEHLDRLGL